MRKLSFPHMPSHCNRALPFSHEYYAFLSGISSTSFREKHCPHFQVRKLCLGFQQWALYNMFLPEYLTNKNQTSDRRIRNFNTAIIRIKPKSVVSTTVSLPMSIRFTLVIPLFSSWLWKWGFSITLKNKIKEILTQKLNKWFLLIEIVFWVLWLICWMRSVWTGTTNIYLIISKTVRLDEKGY